MKSLDTILKECEELAFDLNFTRAKKWKAEKKDRVIVGYLPIYVPREIIHAGIIILRMVSRQWQE